MILEFVRERLKDQGFSEEGLFEVAGKLEAVVLKKILEATEPKLSGDGKAEAQAFVAHKDPISLLRFLKSKYSPEEWKMLAHATTAQVLDDYSHEVLGDNGS